MGWRAAYHPLTRWPISALLIGLVLSGCAAAPTPSTTDLAKRLQSGLASGEAAFSAEFSSTLTGASWYDVLHSGAASFRSAGGDALVVSTHFPGDRRTSMQTITVTLADDGTISGVVDDGPRPLWAVDATDLTRATHGTVLSSGLDPGARRAWAARLDRAAVAVASAGILTSTNTWDGGLVVEVPADAADFTAVTGSSADDTAAITSCTSGTPRIVVNPVSFAQGAEWLQATLTHEAVHVATDSPCHQGTGWVVEGAAESVAAMTDAATAKSDTALVRAYLRRHPLPTALPSEVTTPTDYALAQVAVDAVRWKLDDRAASFIADGIDHGLSADQTATATRLYLAALRRLR